ncbi:ArnT family glycosyltransferase [Corallococcus macrosporus]|uniref:ArnT family glycosyltransferase n=1 Tax=Corallococcus macrosporus TaxID=35 RepID=UPI00031E1A22|nr:glycosyltransferase family 39 protein [Corallococcus macrosporus]
MERVRLDTHAHVCYAPRLVRTGDFQTPPSNALHLPWAPLLLVGGGAWLLRVAGFFHRGGALGYPVDYDEGVYFSAAALLSHGVLPYRDYFFVHPPGVALLWAPVAALTRVVDAATAFSVARWFVPVLGALSAVLCGRIAQSHWGTRAGIVAALVYAVHPEAAATERGFFLEPLLNLTCLGMAWVLLLPATGRRSWRQDAGAGVLLATACAIKLTAGVWVLAVVWALCLGGEGRRAVRVIGTAALTGLIWLGPFLVLAAEPMLEGLLRFQVMRPPDGELSTARRLLTMLGESHWGGALLSLLGLAVALGRLRRRDAVAERLFSAAWLLTVAAFLSAKSYWGQYNAGLAPAAALLSGLGASQLLLRAERHSRRFAAAVTLAVGLAALSALPVALRSANQRERGLLAIGGSIRAAVPPDAPLCAFEPAWAIAAGRLPGLPVGSPALVDPYGLMLNDALDGPSRFASAAAAFADDRTQRTVLPMLARCDALVLLGRGEWQLSAASERWVDEHFTRDGDVWKRKP